MRNVLRFFSRKSAAAKRKTKPRRMRLERLEDRQLLSIDPNGQLGFALRLGSTSGDAGAAIATDASGNVYVAGLCDGTLDFDPGPAATKLAGDAFIAKYTSGGTLTWARTITGDIGYEGADIAVDASGNVYVTGGYQGQVDFDPGTGVSYLTSVASPAAFVLKLNSSGNFAWARSFAGGETGGLGIAADALGNVYSTGFFAGSTDFDPGAGSVMLTAAGAYDAYIVKLDAAGNYLWACRAGSDAGTGGNWDNGDRGYDITVDTDGNVYSTGMFRGIVDFDPGAGTANLTSCGDMQGNYYNDAYVWKLDTAGHYVWAKRLGGPATGESIAIDADRNVYTAGQVYGDDADFDPGSGTYALPGANNRTLYVSKLTAAGDFAWADGLATGPLLTTDYGAVLALDQKGGVYLSGAFGGTADVNPGAGTFNLTSVGGTDVFVAHLDAATGGFLGAAATGGTSDDAPIAIAADASANVYTTGLFVGTADFNPGSGTSTLTSAGDKDAFVWRLAYGDLPMVIDNGDAGCTKTGTWTAFTAAGCQGDLDFAAKGTGTSTASWTFAVTPGRYRVSTTWMQDPNRATDAPYTIYDGATSLATVAVNQQLTPSDASDLGVGWKVLGEYTVSGTSLVVKLTNQANGYVIADAVRLERVGEPAPTLSLAVSPGTFAENAGSSAATGTVTRTGATTSALTVALASSDTTEATVPATVTIPVGQSSATFAVAAVDDAAVDGTQGITLTASATGFTSGTASLQVTDNEQPATQIVDNGDTAYTKAGAWTAFTTAGYQKDLDFAPKGSGASVASWSFTVTPGRYRVAATWLQDPNRATNAPYTVYDGATSVGTASVNQQSAPSGISDQSTAWTSLGDFNISGTSLVVKLTNAANGYVIADAVRIERLGDLTPTLTLAVAPSTFAENAGSAAATGALTRSGATTSDLAVTLAGSDTTEATVPTTVTIPAGQSSTTFTVAAVDDTAVDGTQSVTLTASATGFVSGTASLQVTDNEQPATQIVDNGDTAYTKAGTWTAFTTAGYQKDLDFAAKGNGTSTASWTFTVTPGRYRVAATWLQDPNRATNAPYTIYDGATIAGSASVNQQAAPSGISDQSTAWTSLGDFNISGTSLVVKLTNLANGYVIADAVRIERLGDLTPTLTLSVTPAAFAENAGSSAATGTIARSGATTSDLTVTLTSNDTTEATVPATVTIPAGQSSATFAVAAVDDATVDGTQSVTLTAAATGFTSGTAGVQVTDNEQPTTQILDNGDSGYTKTGTWTAFTTAGYQKDLDFAAKGTGTSTASWSFTVTPGRYRVAATWLQDPNRATNAPYTIYDGTNNVGTASVNQQAAPSGISDQSTAWTSLGDFNITGTSLVVKLTNLANGYVIADAVRIERLGDLTPTLTLAVTPSAFLENAGAGAATGTVTRTGATTSALTVALTSSDTTEATVPATVTIPVGQSSATFAVAAVDDTISDGTQNVTLTAAATGFTSGTAALQVADNEVPTVQIIDNGDAGYTKTGAWTAYSGAGYQKDIDYAAKGTGTITATWTFTVTPGEYRVSASWMQDANRASDAPYTVYDGTTADGTVKVNQQQAANDLTDQGTAWEDLGGPYYIYGTTLRVTLTNAASGYVIADAVRIERLSDLVLDGLSGAATDLARDHVPDLPVPAAAQADFTTDASGMSVSRTRLLVMPTATATVADFNAAVQAAGAKIVGSIADIKALVLRIADMGNLSGVTAALAVLNASPAVAMAADDAVMGLGLVPAPSTLSDWTWHYPPALETNSPTPVGSWGMEAIRAPALWNLNDYAARNTGQARVAILDGGFVDANSDGIDDHADLKGVQTWQFNAATNNFIPGATTWVGYHGQAMAGLYGASFNNRDASGTALGTDGLNAFAERDATADGHLLGVSAVPLEDKNSIDMASLLGTLDRLLLRWPNLDVVSLSWSYGVPDSTRAAQEGLFMRALAALHPQTLFVSISGNQSEGLPTEIDGAYASPFNWAALAPTATSAKIDDWCRAASSNILVAEATAPAVGNTTVGEEPYLWQYYKADLANMHGQVSAPGQDVKVDWGTGYSAVSGTSAAAPTVAGLIGALKTLDPSLTVAQLRQLVTDPIFTRTTALIPGEQAPYGVAGPAPMIDAFAAAMGIDVLQGNQKMQKALVDVDDGSLDGNARRDQDDWNNNGNTTETVAMLTVDGRRGDGVVDMKDFRAFRDALLETLDDDNADKGPNEDQAAFSTLVKLDGAADNTKFDLNADGKITRTDPLTENEYPRFDFNGNGTLEAAGRFTDPGSDGVAPFKVDPDTACTGLDTAIGALRDIDVLADPNVWSPTADVSSDDLLQDLDHDDVVDYLYSADLHLQIAQGTASLDGMQIHIESLKAGSPVWSRTVSIDGNWTSGTVAGVATLKRVVTVPLYGERNVRITLLKDGQSVPQTLSGLDYGQDVIVKLVDPKITDANLKQKEGNSGYTTFNIGVTLPTALPAACNVKYSTASGTATAGVDYLTVTDAVLAFAANQTSPTAPMRVSVVGDTLPEYDKTFQIKLGGGAVQTGTGENLQALFVIPEKATVTIQDDENVLGRYSGTASFTEPYDELKEGYGAGAGAIGNYSVSISMIVTQTTGTMNLGGTVTAVVDLTKTPDGFGDPESKHLVLTGQLSGSTTAATGAPYGWLQSTLVWLDDPNDGYYGFGLTVAAHFDTAARTSLTGSISVGYDPHPITLA